LPIKADLSRILQCLSEKAKSTTEYVSKLKTLPELIEESSSQFKNVLVGEFDEMIRMLEHKKKELVDFIDTEKTTKVKSIKDQVGYLSSKIQKTTGLLQFCVETLKEQDPSSFLQISEHMINRMSEIEGRFPPIDIDYSQVADFSFDFLLNNDQLVKEIKKLHYKQIKVPTAPCFNAEECRNDTSATAPIIILSWQAKAAQLSLTQSQSKSSVTNSSFGGNNNSVQGYILEIDDGTFDGQFKQVYCGPDTMCQINGLVSNSVYNARVKAFNQAGCSEYSQIISIPASPSN
jgi:tripartite motif-containing protein 9/67